MITNDNETTRQKKNNISRDGCDKRFIKVFMALLHKLPAMTVVRPWLPCVGRLIDGLCNVEPLQLPRPVNWQLDG